MPSGFDDAAKILLTASPVWTLVTTAADRGAVGTLPHDSPVEDFGLLPPGTQQTRPNHLGLPKPGRASVTSRYTRPFFCANRWRIIVDPADSAPNPVSFVKARG